MANQQQGAYGKPARAHRCGRLLLAEPRRLGSPELLPRLLQDVVGFLQWEGR